MALEFESSLYEAKVWYLITKPFDLLFETDLDINLAEGSIQTEGTIFQREDNSLSLGGDAGGVGFPR